MTDLKETKALLPSLQPEEQDHVLKAIDFYTGSTLANCFSTKEMKKSIEWLRCARPDIFDVLQKEKKALREEGEEEVLLKNITLSATAQEKIALWMDATADEKISLVRENEDGTQTPIPSDKEIAPLLKIAELGTKASLTKMKDKNVVPTTNVKLVDPLAALPSKIPSNNTLSLPPSPQVTPNPDPSQSS